MSEQLFGEELAPLINRVYSFVAARIGHGAEAEDVTSEVFERAIRFSRTFDPRRGEPISWLIGIARRAIVDARPEMRQRAQEREEPTADHAESAVERLTVWGAVARLEETDRELLALRYGSDLTARQIATIFGERTNTVEVALHRARRRLRRELEGQTGPSAPVRIQAMSAVFTVEDEILDEQEQAR